jgi:formylmethanofuran dehydrogenase subunit E
MKDFKSYVKEVGDYHGHVCGGIITGTKLTLAALKKLGFEPGVKNKKLIVYVEVDRCMTDAVQVITRCSLGHRSLKYADYGKFAASFINIETGEGVRVTIKQNIERSDDIEKQIEQIGNMPDEAIVVMQPIKIQIPETDLPGRPLEKAICSQCGERIMDGREVRQAGKVLCRACAGSKYYSEI